MGWMQHQKVILSNKTVFLLRFVKIYYISFLIPYMQVVDGHLTPMQI